MEPPAEYVKDMATLDRLISLVPSDMTERSRELWNAWCLKERGDAAITFPEGDDDDEIQATIKGVVETMNKDLMKELIMHHLSGEPIAWARHEGVANHFTLQAQFLEKFLELAEKRHEAGLPPLLHLQVPYWLTLEGITKYDRAVPMFNFPVRRRKRYLYNLLRFRELNMEVGAACFDPFDESLQVINLGDLFKQALGRTRYICSNSRRLKTHDKLDCARNDSSISGMLSFYLRVCPDLFGATEVLRASNELSENDWLPSILMPLQVALLYPNIREITVIYQTIVDIIPAELKFIRTRLNEARTGCLITPMPDKIRTSCPLIGMTESCRESLRHWTDANLQRRFEMRKPCTLRIQLASSWLVDVDNLSYNQQEELSDEIAPLFEELQQGIRLFQD